jgi:hypothetical protein
VSTPQNSILGYKTGILAARLATRSDELRRIEFWIAHSGNTQSQLYPDIFFAGSFHQTISQWQKTLSQHPWDESPLIPEAPEFTLEQALDEN